MSLLSPVLREWRIRKVLGWLRGESILDCGCGSGSLLDAIGKEKHYVGIDVNKECINGRHVRKGAKFLLMDVERDELRIGKFDSVVACALIEHLTNPSEFISKISRLLNKNGRILITTPTSKADIILNLGSYIGIFDRGAYEEHKVYWDYEDFRRVAQELGLRIEHYERFQLGLNQLVVLSRTA